MGEEQYNKLIEKLKEADDHHYPAGEAMAWEKMNAELDATFRKKKKRRFFIWFFLLLPLLVAGVWLLNSGTSPRRDRAENNNLKITSNNQAEIKTKAGAKLKDSTQESLAADSKNKQTYTNNTRLPEEQKSKKINVEIAAIQNEDQPVEKNLITAHNKSYSTRRSPVLSQKERSNDTHSTSAATTTTAHSRLPANQLKIPVIAKAKGSDDDDFLVRKNPAEIEPVLSVNKPFIHPSFPDSLLFQRHTSPLMASQQKLQEAGNVSDKLSINAVGSVYSTWARPNDGYKSNKAFGLQVAYLFQKRFTVSAGVLFSRVTYHAAAQSYNPKTPVNTWGYTLQNIAAVCHTIEVPVSLHYNFLTGKRYRFFVGAGVSSQFTKRENYYYTSKRNDTTVHGTWNYPDGNKHLFSVATINTGVSYQFATRWSVSAVPFYKLPLKGLGFGQVKLQAAGVDLMLGFHPLNKRRKK